MDKENIIYTIKIKNSVKKDLSKISEPYFSKIEDKVLKLRENPIPSDCKKLKGMDNAYRIRVSDYRIVYTIQNNILLVEVIKVGHRKDIYKTF